MERARRAIRTVEVDLDVVQNVDLNGDVDVDSIVELARRPMACPRYPLENDQGPIKVEDNERVNVEVAVKLNVGVDVEVMVKVDDPSYAPELLFYSS